MCVSCWGKGRLGGGEGHAGGDMALGWGLVGARRHVFLFRRGVSLPVIGKFAEVKMCV